jgi:hypothetical protein
MRKVIVILILTIALLPFISCGGKEMNLPPDGTRSGPNYFNPDYNPHSDTNVVNRPSKSFLETQDLSEPSMDSGTVGQEKSIVRQNRDH